MPLFVAIQGIVSTFHAKRSSLIELFSHMELYNLIKLHYPAFALFAFYT